MEGREGGRREEERRRGKKGGEKAGKGEALRHFSFYNLTTVYTDAANDKTCLTVCNDTFIHLYIIGTGY